MRTHTHISAGRRFFGPLLIAWFFVSGCVHTDPAARQAPAWSGPQARNVQHRYVLQAGDVLSIKFLHIPRFDATVKVRPDGFISLAPVDEIRAAGLTAKELDSALTSLASEKIANAELSITVTETSARGVYVGGEVKNDGIHALQPNMTAFQAILAAGGTLPTSDLHSVVVIRRGRENEPTFMTVDLAEDLKAKTVMNDLPLEPFDVVYVPASPIARLDLFVDQYIRKLIPFNLNAGFSYIESAGKTSVNFDPLKP